MLVLELKQELVEESEKPGLLNIWLFLIYAVVEEQVFPLGYSKDSLKVGVFQIVDVVDFPALTVFRKLGPYFVFDQGIRVENFVFWV